MITWQRFPNALKFGWAFRYPWEPMNMGGVNFAVFSRHASRVLLELFDLPVDATPARVIDCIPRATAPVLSVDGEPQHRFLVFG